MHPIIGAEELSRERDELGISRMIQSLYRADPLLHVRPVLGYVVFQFRLGGGRTSDQDRTRVRQRVDDSLEEFRVHAPMTPPHLRQAFAQLGSRVVRSQADIHQLTCPLPLHSMPSNFPCRTSSRALLKRQHAYP